MKIYPTFKEACRTLQNEFNYQAYSVKSEKWQGVETKGKPEMEMREILFTGFGVPMRGLEFLGHWQQDIEPNLPFADAHFEERVSGVPSNPGEAWKIWPWANSADKHRTAGEKFTHTYQERFWPKHAGHSPEALEYIRTDNRTPVLPITGIRYPYGDLDDVIQLLYREPLTRQAYLPVWFPEDTGVVHGGRVPCTLGYHLINRHDYLHIRYDIRSCDFVRHFRDDCYFTVRLALHALKSLRRLDDRWEKVKPGMFTMNITSLHMFINDYHKMFPEKARARPPRND